MASQIIELYYYRLTPDVLVTQRIRAKPDCPAQKHISNPSGHGTTKPQSLVDMYIHIKIHYS